MKTANKYNELSTKYTAIANMLEGAMRQKELTNVDLVDAASDELREALAPYEGLLTGTPFYP